jgi:hypothetical protein
MFVGLAKVIGGLVLALALAFALFWGWYCVAANYDYDALAGTYSFHAHGVSSTLILRADGSFHQEVQEGNRREVADGSWNKAGEAGVGFSKEFLRLPDAKTQKDDFGPGAGLEIASEFYGHFEKIAGLYPVLYLNASPPDVTFHRRLRR